jgi:hypothetical protein
LTSAVVVRLPAPPTGYRIEVKVAAPWWVVELTVDTFPGAIRNLYGQKTCLMPAGSMGSLVEIGTTDPDPPARNVSIFYTLNPQGTCL